MIGIITYVSVIERTKEIGIMRSLGARKKDISRIFNAETIIIGFASGLLGIGITLGLNIPIDFIILELLDVPNFTNLTPLNILILVVLSTALTLLAGLIPSGIAAKKDPVIALRTE
jgi:putative ABC transport system permease protein